MRYYVSPQPVVFRIAFCVGMTWGLHAAGHNLVSDLGLQWLLDHTFHLYKLCLAGCVGSSASTGGRKTWSQHGGLQAFISFIKYMWRWRQCRNSVHHQCVSRAWTGEVLGGDVQVWRFFYVCDKKVASVIWIMWKQMSMTTGTLFSRILLLNIWGKVVFESKQFVTWWWYFSFAVTAWHSWWIFEQFYVLWIWACLLPSAAIAELERRSVLGIVLFIIGSKTSFVFLNICMKSLMPGESGKTKIEEIRIQIPILTILRK